MKDRMSESKTLRWAAFSFNGFIDTVNDGKADGRCSFGGHYAVINNIVMDGLWKYVNCTVLPHDNLGHYDKETKSYTEAIGKLEDGNADVLIVPAYYPFHEAEDDDPKFDYSLPINSDNMMMACAYHNNVTESELDLMSMFTSVPTNLWWLTFGSFLTFVLVLNVGYRVLRLTKKYKSPFWMVTSAFLFEDNFPEDIPFNKIITVTATTFLFFFGNYLLNTMSSDLVVFDEPEVIIGFEGILERNASGREIKVLLFPGLSETHVFQDAPEGTIENELWKLNEQISVKDSVTDTFIKLLDPLIHQKVVPIFRESVTRAISALFYLHLESIQPELAQNLSGLLSGPEDSTQRFVSAFIVRKSMDPFVKSKLFYRFQQLLENGMWHHSSDYFYMTIGQEKGFMALIEKTSIGMIPSQQPPLPFIRLSHTKDMFIIIGSMFLIAIVVFLFERAYYAAQREFDRNNGKREIEIRTINVGPNKFDNQVPGAVVKIRDRRVQTVHDQSNGKLIGTTKITTSKSDVHEH